MVSLITKTKLGLSLGPSQPSCSSGHRSNLEDHSFLLAPDDTIPSLPSAADSAGSTVVRAMVAAPLGPSCNSGGSAAAASNSEHPHELVRSIGREQLGGLRRLGRSFGRELQLGAPARACPLPWPLAVHQLRHGHCCKFKGSIPHCCKRTLIPGPSSRFRSPSASPAPPTRRSSSPRGCVEGDYLLNQQIANELVLLR